MRCSDCFCVGIHIGCKDIPGRAPHTYTCDNCSPKPSHLFPSSLTKQNIRSHNTVTSNGINNLTKATLDVRDSYGSSPIRNSNGRQLSDASLSTRKNKCDTPSVSNKNSKGANQEDIHQASASRPGRSRTVTENKRGRGKKLARRNVFTNENSSEAMEVDDCNATTAVATVNSSKKASTKEFSSETIAKQDAADARSSSMDTRNSSRETRNSSRDGSLTYKRESNLTAKSRTAKNGASNAKDSAQNESLSRSR